MVRRGAARGRVDLLKQRGRRRLTANIRNKSTSTGLLPNDGNDGHKRHRITMPSTISFTCSECNHAIVEDVHVPDTNMEDNEGSSSQDIIECPNCRRAHFVIVNNRSGIVLATVDGRPLEDGAVSPPDPVKDYYDYLQEEWLEEYSWYQSLNQQSVHEYFTSSLQSLRSMLTIRIEDRGQTEVFNRMLLVQGVASMESFLSDTLISRTIADPIRLRRLFEFDRELNKSRYSMSEFLNDKEIANKVAKQYLSGLLYHNLPKIELLYREVLGVEFYYWDEDVKQDLLRAIQLRHDCVHRNGKSKDYGDVQAIDRAYVALVLTQIETFVNAIEKALQYDDDTPF